MNKNTGKISLGTAICLFIIILLIIALAVVYYLGFIKYTERLANADGIENKVGMQATNIVENTANDEIEEELKTEKNEQVTVPTSDLVVFVNLPNGTFFAYIEDGILYYAEDYSGIATKDEMIKSTKLDNIKRIKMYNIGTAINPQLFLITEDGQVYTMRYLFSNEIEKYDELADYKVEDILSHTGEMDSIFELLLKDGTTTTVTVDLGI